jgi:aryl-alcohol dehydrogenase-like predicted oxidoreductase
VHFALDRGIRFFDTAAGYGAGRSEALLGQALASSELGAEAVVCTKVALTTDEAAAGRAGPHLVAELEGSLRRLRRDHVDILLLHGPPDALDWHQFDRSVLDLLRADGKILAYGVSSGSLAGAERVLEAGFGSCIEWAFNVLERRPANRLFPRLAAHRMNFIARSPLGRGTITPKYAATHGAAFSERDFRSTLPQEWVDWSATSAGKLVSIAGHAGGLTQFALRYCLSYAEVSAVIPGMYNRGQVEDLLSAAAAGPLEPDVIAHLGDLVDDCYPPWT